MEIEHVENSPKSHFHQLLPILQIRKILNCNNSTHGQNFAKKKLKVVVLIRLFQQRLSKFRDMLWHSQPELPDSQKK